MLALCRHVRYAAWNGLYILLVMIYIGRTRVMNKQKKNPHLTVRPTRASGYGHRPEPRRV